VEVIATLAPTRRRRYGRNLPSRSETALYVAASVLAASPVGRTSFMLLPVRRHAILTTARLIEHLLKRRRARQLREQRRLYRRSALLVLAAAATGARTARARAMDIR
jgi:hypothetical protein